MIDEGHELPESRRETDADSYLYDFFKFLTSLSVLTLAAIFTVSQLHGAMQRVGKLSFGFILACVAVAGMLSFMGASELVRTKLGGKPGWSKIEFFRKAAPLAYALGVGGFLMMFVDVLR